MAESTLLLADPSSLDPFREITSGQSYADLDTRDKKPSAVVLV